MFRKISKILGLVLIVIPIAIIILGMIVHFVWNFQDIMSERKFYSNFKKEIDKGKKEILVKDLTWFEWGRVCLVYSYNFDSLWQKEFGDEYKKPFTWPDDGIAYIIFVSKQKDVMIFSHYQSFYGEVGNDGKCVSSKKANLLYVNRNENNKCTNLYYDKCLILTE